MSIWRGYDIAEAFGIADEGLVLHGVFCLNTPFGLATPSLYRGNLNFLQWLGAALPQINTRLGRLGVSRLVKAPSGHYYANIADDIVILSTLEAGPSCDPRNAFELFTVAAGVAHVHQQPVQAVSGSAPDWLTYYQAQADKLAQLRPPNLPKRSLAAWTHLEETWRLCVEEAINVLDELKQVPKETCLTLGLNSFSDFVYLADRHQVHYNSVANCHLGSPVIDIARLVISASGETRIAHNMLLSYQRVRELSQQERKELLAHLWFPHELDLTLLADSSANPLHLQRASNMLQEKIGMISELEDILLTPSNEETEVQNEKEVLVVSRKKANVPTVAAPELEIEKSETSEMEVVEQVETQPEVVAECAEEQVEEQQDVQDETPVINMTATTKKQATVWGPFPPPLGAEAVPPVPSKDLSEQTEEANVTPETDGEETDIPLW